MNLFPIHNIVTEFFIPTDIIDIVYQYTKNNCTFIIIFENNQHENSYLHEIDIESGTNINLSTKYMHQNHIWTRAPGAAYCYGRYHNKTTVFRLGGELVGHRNESGGVEWSQRFPSTSTTSLLPESIGCIVKTGDLFKMPPLHRTYAQAVYSRNHGLYVLGGIKCSNDIQHYRSVLRLNETTMKWENTMPSMMHERCGFLSVFQESQHYGISDKIYCVGGCIVRDEAHGAYGDQAISTCEYYDFSNNQWYSMNNTIEDRSHFGGCIDNETYKLVIAGGDSSRACKTVDEFDFEKNKWYKVGGRYCYTNYQHICYPKVTKHNKVTVIFGNKAYIKGDKEWGYVEFFDERSFQNKWNIFGSLRELLQFSGSQVRAGCYQQMVQI